MKDAEEAPGYGRTNWRRFAVAVGVPTAIAGGMVLALQQGALAASFTVSGQDFHLTASSLYGDHFTQYSGVESTKKTNPAGGIPPNMVALSGIQHATLHNLCQSVVAKTPWGTDVTLRITAGKTSSTDPKDKDGAVTADDLLIGMSDLKGNATFTKIEIGNDAGDLSGNAALNGTFGQRADSVVITDLKQTASSTTAGTFTLNGMHLALSMGNKDCFTNGAVD